MERKRVDHGEQGATRRRTPTGAALIRADLTMALYRALFEDWAAQGYPAISLERVAQRAGAGKAAIYRRWSSKAAFAAEALEATAVGLTDVSDHGGLAADLEAWLLAARRVLRHRLARRIVPDLHAERMRSGDLAAALDRLAAARRSQGVGLVERAVARGELPASIDRALAMDVIPSALYWRMVVRGKRVTRDDVRRQVTVLLLALRAC